VIVLTHIAMEILETMAIKNKLEKKEEENIQSVEKQFKRKNNVVDIVENLINNNHEIYNENDKENDYSSFLNINTNHNNNNNEKKIKDINTQMQLIEKYLSQLQIKHKMLSDFKQNMTTSNNRH